MTDESQYYYSPSKCHPLRFGGSKQGDGPAGLVIDDFQKTMEQFEQMH